MFPACVQQRHPALLAVWGKKVSTFLHARSNAILLCDGKGCRAAAHQACYGVAAVPEGEWRCDGCAAGLDPRRAHCLMCPVAGGALRAVASLGAVRPPSGARLGVRLFSSRA